MCVCVEILIKYMWLFYSQPTPRRAWNTWCEEHAWNLKPVELRVVSLDIPVTERNTLLFSQQRRKTFEDNIKAQVCATLGIPPACVTVFVVRFPKSWFFV
jgi:hypothetical protein